jgi:hypothetical protein
VSLLSVKSRKKIQALRIFDAAAETWQLRGLNPRPIFRRLPRLKKWHAICFVQARRCFMRDKVLQMPRPSSTGFARMRILKSWNAPSAGAVEMDFLHDWFEVDPEVFDLEGLARVNWGAISGLALSVAISASFWAAVVWVAARVI